MNPTPDKPTPTPAPSAPAPSTSAPPRRRRRWLRRLAVVVVTLAVLLLIGLVALVVALRSSLPERIVEREATAALGVRVQVQDVDVGIFGSTTIRGLRATMPLEDEPFLVVPEVHARHTALPMLLLTTPTLERVSIPRPTLSLRQRPSGAWNLEQIVNRLQAQASRGGSTGGGGPSTPRLPTIRLDEATVHVVPRDGPASTFERVSIHTDGSDPLVYRLAIEVPDRIDLSGTLLPGGDWRQNLAFDVRDPGPLLRPFVGPIDLPDNASARGTWTGRLDRGTPTGQLAIDQLTYADLAATLRTSLRVGDGIVAAPSSLLVEVAGQRVRLSDGQLSLRGDELRVAGLQVRGLGGLGLLDGHYNLADRGGALELLYDDVQVQDVRSSGTVRATLRTLAMGGHEIAATLDTRAAVADRRLGSVVTIDASGPTFQQMRWTARARELLLAGPRTYRVPEVLARGRHEIDPAGRSMVLLESLEVPGADVLSGVGGVILEPGVPPLWWGWAYARELVVDVPRVGERGMLLNANLWGRGLQANILDVYTRLGDAELYGDGIYDRASGPEALRLALTIRKLTPIEADPRLQFIRGVLWGRATITGELHPLDLQFTGQAYARDLLLGRRPVGDVAAVVIGEIDPAGARFASRDIALFQGTWTFDLDVPFEERERVRLQLAGNDVPTRELGQFWRVRNLVGDIDVALDATLDSLSLDGLDATATLGGERVGVERYVLDELALPVTIEDGRLTARPTLRKGDGSGSATLEADLRKPTLIGFRGELIDWPATPAGAPLAAQVTARTDPIRIDLDAPLDGGGRGVTVAGEFQIAGVAALEGQPLADLQLRGVLDRRRLVVPDINGELIGGRIGGGGHVHADDLTDTLLDLRFNDVHAERLVTLFPVLEGLAGSVDGVFRLGPPTKPRPLGPLQLDINLFGFDARYRSVALGNSFLTGFFERSGDARLSFNRFVTDDSRIALAGGEVRPFLRLSQRNGREYWSQVTIDLERLDLQQLARLGVEDTRGVGGQVSGSLTAFGNLTDLLTVTASGQIRVDQADVASLPVLRQIYAAANVFGGDEDASNVATLDLHFSSDTLALRRAEVFDQGLYIQGVNIQLAGLSRWPQTELSGYALATARPLRSVELPFFDTLFQNADGILNVLQQQATTVRLGGTVENYTVTPAALSEVFDAIRGLLGAPPPPPR